MSTESGISPDFSSDQVRAVLQTDTSRGVLAILRARIAGVPLFERHLLAFRQAGIRHVIVKVPSAILTDVQRLAQQYSPRDIDVRVEPADNGVSAIATPEIEQSLDTLVDPRLVTQLVRLAQSQSGLFVCADAPGGEDVEAKSPYRVGVPEDDEASIVETSAAVDLVPIGLALRVPIREAPGAASVSTRLAVGRYYWHRLRHARDARLATWKVLLATMKATDGVYARTNRRVSLRISRLLVGTAVTPNEVTIATLGLGVVAGWLLAQGHYAPVVAGSVLAWVASMLDGVDGELARAKFQASPFGHWLEMVCDYAFYIVLVVGLGEGFRRLTGQRLWLLMGLATAVGVVFGFWAVSRLKRGYSPQGDAANFYRAYQHSIEAPTASWWMRLTPHLTVFATRAAFPYYFVLFAVLGLAKFVLVMFFVGTYAFSFGALLVSRTTLANGARVIDQSRSSIPPSAGLD